MNSRLKLICFVAFALHLFNAVSFAELIFKMTAGQGDLGHPISALVDGEKVTVHVWAWVNDAIAEPNNGLDTWQMDLDVDTTGVIQITKTGDIADITLIAPDPDMGWSGWNESSVNSPITGEAREVVVTQQITGAPSYTGVSEYSEIFSFQVEAIGVGTATYTLKDDGGGLFYGVLSGDQEFENGNPEAYGGVVFNAQDSANVFTVVPEPGSLLIMAFMAGFALRSRKLDSGK